MAHITSHRASAERYTGLRLLSVIFTVLGALLLTVGGLGRRQAGAGRFLDVERVI